MPIMAGRQSIGMKGTGSTASSSSAAGLTSKTSLVKRSKEGLQRNGQLSIAEVALICDYRDAGYSKSAVTRLTGYHYNTIKKYWYADPEPIEDLRVPGFDKLSAEAKRALEDFAYFRERYFGRIARPWHVQAANKVVELLETEDDEYLVINCPPGSGKSSLLNDIVCWVLTKDRTKRVLLGSAAQTTAADYSTRVMNDLTRPDPWRANARALALGLEQDGQATLQADFGRYKPANGARWTKEKFYVAQPEGRTVQEKEPSVVAFGRDSTFLGGRFDLCVWDDLVSEKTHRGEDARERLIRWWTDTAETRTEPGGLHVLCGQRLYPDDLYRYALDLPAGDAEETPDGSYPRKYHHIVFPAHDDEHCTGLHEKDSPPLGDGGCLLDPARLPWKKLQMLKANPLSNFATVYQQQDGNPDSALVQQAWIDGGRSPNGEEFIGCLDRERGRWQLPPLAGEVWSVIAVDPSPTRFWSIQAWAYHPGSKQWFLLDMIRDRIQYPQWLKQTGDRWSGIAVDWAHNYRVLGHPLEHVIFEQAAAQRFVIPQMQDWARTQNRLLIVSHDTHAANKNHTDYGVQSVAPLWLHGEVRLPYRSETDRETVKPLIREVTTWPDGATDDCVMAHWFAVYNSRLKRKREAAVEAAPRPSWLAGGVHLDRATPRRGFA